MKRLMSLCLAAFAALYLASASAAAPINISNPHANPPPAAAAPVAAHFDADQATAEWMALIPAEAKAKSDAYYEGGYWLILWDFVVGLAVAWLLLGTRFSVRMREAGEFLARIGSLQYFYMLLQCLFLLLILPATLVMMLFRVFRSGVFKLPGSPGGFKWPVTLCYALLYVFLTTLITLPWNLYEGYFREHQYGMSNQEMSGFLGDQMTALMLGLVAGAVVLSIIYAVIRNAPRTWWIWGALVGIAFIIFSVAIGPPLLEPMFNKFYPLKEGVQKEQILSLARANGIPATDVYEFDNSKQTKRMSAHVSGLGGTTQISLNDNLVNRGSPEEVQAVLGHEMGHYVLHHVFHGIVEGSVLVILCFAFLKWSFEKMRVRYGGRWGIRDVGDVAGLPLLAALLSVYFLVLTPVTNTLTRTQEAEADIFGLNTARQPDGFAQAAIHLSEYRKMEPGTLEEIFFYDHPSGYHRIHRAMVWKAEHIDAPDIVAYDAVHPKIEMPPEPPTQ